MHTDTFFQTFLLIFYVVSTAVTRSGSGLEKTASDGYPIKSFVEVSHSVGIFHRVPGIDRKDNIHAITPNEWDIVQQPMLPCPKNGSTNSLKIENVLCIFISQALCTLYGTNEGILHTC